MIIAEMSCAFFWLWRYMGLTIPKINKSNDWEIIILEIILLSCLLLMLFAKEYEAKKVFPYPDSTTCRAPNPNDVIIEIVFMVYKVLFSYNTN